MNKHSAKLYVLEPAAPIAGTPEEMMIVDPAQPGGVPVDALSCALARASGTLSLLMADADDPAGFSVDHSTVCDALWALDGLIKQARILVGNHARGVR